MAAQGKEKSALFWGEGEIGMAGRSNQKARHLEADIPVASIGHKGQGQYLLPGIGRNRSDVNNRVQTTLLNTERVCPLAEFPGHFQTRRETRTSIQAIWQFRKRRLH